MASAAVTTLSPSRQVHRAIHSEARHAAQKSGLLKTLFLRQSSHCFWCGDLMVMTAFRDRGGKQIEDPHKATVDHVIALVVGGPTDDKNCVAACRACNDMRSQYNTAAWRREMSKKDSQLRAARNLTQWMTQQLLEEREKRVAAEDAAAMHLATVEMTTRPESGWQKLCRWLRG